MQWKTFLPGVTTRSLEPKYNNKAASLRMEVGLCLLVFTNVTHVALQWQTEHSPSNILSKSQSTSAQHVVFETLVTKKLLHLQPNTQTAIQFSKYRPLLTALLRKQTQRCCVQSVSFSTNIGSDMATSLGCINRLLENHFAQSAFYRTNLTSQCTFAEGISFYRRPGGQVT